jgi:hypothetical protein
MCSNFWASEMLYRSAVCQNYYCLYLLFRFVVWKFHYNNTKHSHCHLLTFPVGWVVSSVFTSPPVHKHPCKWYFLLCVFHYHLVTELLNCHECHIFSFDLSRVSCCCLCIKTTITVSFLVYLVLVHSDMFLFSLFKIHVNSEFFSIMNFYSDKS